MTKWILMLVPLICVIIAIGGCDSDGEGVPEIIGSAAHTILKPVVPILPHDNTTYSQAVDKNIPPAWYPLRNREKGWEAIVIHHSATHRGNVANFDDWHKNGRHWQGVGYDFVIGNGDGSGDGQVEVTFRWREQIAGAHVGGTPRNWANEDAVGICLVGDFTKTRPTYRQMQSLVNLIRFLQRRYKIPKSRIYGHSNTPGYKGKTACPGKNFPWARLERML
jgi:N-acetyl-anhydromuramyl-L-alanine amidase AmpD